MTTKIGAVAVDLGLNTAQFQAGVRQANASAKTLSGTFSGLGKAAMAGLAGFAGIAGVTSAINGTKEALNAFGKIADAAASSGLDSEFFQGIAHQASLAGVGMDTLSGALDTFNKNSGLAAVNKGKMIAALQALNPELLRNIQAATTQEQRVRLAADAIAAAGTASEKAALSTALFGEAGSSLAAVFAGGAAEIQRMQDVARNMGIIVDRDLIARADQLGDEFDTASQIVDLKLKQAFINLAPQLVGAANLAAEFARLVGVAADQLKSIEDRQYLRPLQNELAATYNAMQPVKEEIARIEAALAGGAPNGMVLKLDLSEANAKLAAFEAQAMQLLTRITQLQGAPAGGTSSDPSIPPTPALDPNRMGGADLAILDLPAIGLPGIEAVNTQLTNVGSNAASAGAALANMAVDTKAAISPLADQLTGLADTLASGFTDVFTSVIDGSKSAGDAILDLTKSLANMALQQGFQALFGGLFGGGLLSGGGIGHSLGGGLLGFANGGSFNVGGSGGIDSQIVAFKASPNETVSITKPGQEREGLGGPIHVTGSFEVINGNLVPLMTKVSSEVSGQQIKANNRQLPQIMGDIQTRQG